MNDLTAPIDKVLVSRRESFSRGYELFQDETPRDLTGYVFTAQLSGPNFFSRALSEGVGISRPNAYTVLVALTTAQMAALAVGPYTLVLFGERANEKEMIVQLQMQVQL